ncbi:MAG: site-2 protease family protein [Candidatus Zixiibacteriota bacterium]
MSKEERELHNISRLLADLYAVDAMYRQGPEFVFSMTSRADPERTAYLLNERLRTSGYHFDLKARPGESALLTIDPKRHVRIPLVNIVLFVATLLTTYLVPVYMTSPQGEFWSRLQQGAGLEFMAAMMSILFVHEMGHYVAGRRRGIVTSWPYFLPAPNLIGTFGAIIKSKSPFWNRRDLIEVGAWGPVAGWIVALGWLIYGLPKSTLVAMTGENALRLGDSVIMKALSSALMASPPAGYDYMLSEAAFAGWVGLLVTAINLLPVGQLDGGHILYGLAPKRQRLLGWAAWIGLALLGLKWEGWWLFAAFGLIFGVSHPPTLDDHHPIGRSALALGVVALIIFALSLTPAPFQF